MEGHLDNLQICRKLTLRVCSVESQFCHEREGKLEYLRKDTEAVLWRRHTRRRHADQRGKSHASSCLGCRTADLQQCAALHLPEGLC